MENRPPPIVSGLVEAVGSLGHDASPPRGPRKSRIARVLDWGILFSVLAAFCYVAFVPLIRERTERPIKACRRNLTVIDGAKEQFALDHGKKEGDAVTWENLLIHEGGGYLSRMPKEPLGGAYSINPVGIEPTCSTCLRGHRLEPHCRGIVTSIE